MYIITINDQMDDSVTRVAMGCENWAEYFYNFVSEKHDLTVEMGEGDVPVRDNDEMYRVQLWIENFSENAQIGACVND